MRKLAAVTALGILGLALLVGVAETQDKKDKAKGQLPQNWKALDLTASQKDQVYSIQDSYKRKIGELTKQIKELQAQEKTELVKVLTDEQKTKLQKLTLGEDTKKVEKKADGK